MKIIFIFASLFTCILTACNNTNEKMEVLSKNEKDIFLKLGDSIALNAQQTLIQNVSKAIKEKGHVAAVDFCHIQAIPITNSVGSNFAKIIQRKSDKNRNPGNAIQNETDEEAWQELKTLFNENNIQDKHLISQTKDGVFYYKAITLAMPTCLSCHGKPGIDIVANVSAEIKSKYPEDKAIGYELGQMRGMWKIKLD